MYLLRQMLLFIFYHVKIDEETSTVIFGIFIVFFGIIGIINLSRFLTKDSEIEMYKKAIENLQELIKEQRKTLDKLYKELNK